MLDARRMGEAMLGGGRTILQHPGVLIAGLAIVLPWLSWLHLTSAYHSVAALHTPQWLWIMGTMVALGLLIARQDWWLGALVIYTACRAVTADHLGTFEVAYSVTLGAICVWFVQRIPHASHGWIVTGLVASGCLEVLYLIQQALGFDLLWGKWQYAPGWLFGTMGNPSYVGAYLGMLTPLAPWWLVPIFATGLSLTQSGTGMVAGLAGLFVRYGLYRQRVWRLAAMLAFVSGVYWYESRDVTTLMARGIVWSYGLWHLLDAPVLGMGLGGWYARESVSLPWVVEIFYQAHNEYLQWAYDAGIMGLCLVLGWMWAHRKQFLESPVAGGMVAVALASVTMFVFHLTIPALTGLVILGIGTSMEGGAST